MSSCNSGGSHWLYLNYSYNIIILLYNISYTSYYVITVFLSFLSQVRDHDAVRRGVQHIAVRGGRVLLDRLLQLDAQPADLRVLQPGLPGGVQEHAAVRVLQPVPEPAVRPGLAGHAAAVAPVRRPHAQRLLGDVPEPLRPAPFQPVRQQLMIRRAAAQTQALSTTSNPTLPTRPPTHRHTDSDRFRTPRRPFTDRHYPHPLTKGHPTVPSNFPMTFARAVSIVPAPTTPINRELRPFDVSRLLQRNTTTAVTARQGDKPTCRRLDDKWPRSSKDRGEKDAPTRGKHDMGSFSKVF